MAPSRRSAGKAATWRSRFQVSSTAITAKNDRALRAKVAQGPLKLTSTPAMAGPRARATLMPRLDRAMAEGRSRLLTSSGVSADQAGIINAVPTPMARVMPSSSQTVVRPSRVSTASSVATAAIHSCTPSR